MGDYNGWKNRETWNVALHIGNTGHCYECARQFNTYKDFAEALKLVGVRTTPDGVNWLSEKLDYNRLDELIKEIKN